MDVGCPSFMVSWNIGFIDPEVLRRTCEPQRWKLSSWYWFAPTIATLRHLSDWSEQLKLLPPASGAPQGFAAMRPAALPPPLSHPRRAVAETHSSNRSAGR